MQFDEFGHRYTPVKSSYPPPPKVSYFSLSLLKNNFIYLLISGCAGFCCCSGSSLVAASRNYSLVAVPGLLIVVASLVAEHGL